jgi:polynucleotide 5'-hydroxyl-kinase GRC3/NOL9
VQGSVSILGAILTTSTPAIFHPIHAPLSHSLPVIKGLKSKKAKPSESVVQIGSYRSGIERVSEICPFAESLFQPPAHSITISPREPTFHILFDSPTATAQTLYPISWLEAFQTISAEKAPRILVCGQKGSGKSTFSQYLVNSFIHHNPVIYLDTDPGQPSFSPPGMVSIHSLNQPVLSAPFACTEMNDLVRCYHIGNISPRDNPRYYIDCITDLLSHVAQDTPCVINTPGWTKGTGLELLTSLIEIAMPKFIVVLSNFGNDSLAQNLRPIASECQSYLLLIESANTIPPAVQLTAADLRALGIMSYFHRIGVGKWDFTTHLTAWKPWIVKYSGSSEQRGIWAIAIQGEDLLPEDMVLAINGIMVAIVLVSRRTDETVSLTPEGIPVLSNREVKFMEPRSSRCVGYAVIRGIDVKNGWLLLLSPWNPSVLEDGESVVLERGHVNLPVWGMWHHKMSRVLGPWLERL